MSDNINITLSNGKVYTVPREVGMELAKLEAKIKDYESGHRGACFTCEPVGELNKKLEAQLEVLTKCNRGGQTCLVYFEAYSGDLLCQGCKNKKLIEGVKGE